MNELLLPRKTVYFTPSEGRFIPLSSSVPEPLKQPMVRTKKGPFTGNESGYRSGLLEIDGNLYRIKACRPEPGLYADGPRGTQVLSIAQTEADVTLDIRESMIKEGFGFPIEPIGFWAYDHHPFEGESTAATLYKVEGDTRIDELLLWFSKLPTELFEEEIPRFYGRVLQILGQRTGALLKGFHNMGFAWDNTEGYPTNAHPGNVVIYPNSSGHVELGMIDFTYSTRYGKDDPRRFHLQHSDNNKFMSRLFAGDVWSTARKTTANAQTQAVRRIRRVILDATGDKDIAKNEKVQDFALKLLGIEGVSDFNYTFTTNHFFGYSGSSQKEANFPWEEMKRLVDLSSAVGVETLNIAVGKVGEGLNEATLGKLLASP